MDCYSIENPTPGQRCKDDKLGEMVFNAKDGTWELATNNPANVFNKPGTWIGSKINFGSANTTTARAKSFVQTYWIQIMLTGAALLALWLLLRKKK